MDAAAKNHTKKHRFKSMPLDSVAEDEETEKINPHVLFRTDNEEAGDAPFPIAPPVSYHPFGLLAPVQGEEPGTPGGSPQEEVISLAEQVSAGGLRFLQSDSEEEEVPSTSNSNRWPTQGDGIQKGMSWRRRSVSWVKVGRRIVKVVRVDDAKSGFKVKASLAIGKSQIQE